MPRSRFEEAMSRLPSQADPSSITSRASLPRGLTRQGYQDLYNQVKDRNESSRAVTGYTRGGDSRLMRDDDNGMRELNPLERILHKSDQLSERISGITGFDPSKGLDPENVVNFLASLPFQTVSAPLTGVVDLYEAATGTPLHDVGVMGGTPEGWVSTEDMDTSRRAAALGNGVINAVAPFMGGSGGMLKTAGNLATRGRFGSWVGSGVDALVGGSRAAKNAAQLGWDVAEEAGEEFAQSYLEDIRNENLNEGSLGRALTGAGWGALGGGVMGGGSLAVSEAARKAGWTRDTNQADPGDDANLITGRGGSTPDSQQASTDMYQELMDTGRNGGMEGMQRTHQELMDNFNTSRKRGGSAVAKQMIGVSDVGVDESILGADIVKSAFYGSMRKSGGGEAMAARFGTDVDGMRRIFERNEDDGRFHIDVNGADEAYNTSSQALNRLIELGRVDADVAVGRNPDTKNGLFRSKVVGFTEGGSFQLNPMTYSLVGSDTDGDTAAIYFNGVDDVNANGWATEMLMSPEGRSQTNWWYSGIDTATPDRDIDGAIRDVLAPYSGAVLENGENLVDAAVREVTAGVHMGMNDDERSTALGRAFNNIVTRVNGSMNGQGDGSEGRTAANEIIKRLSRGQYGSVGNYISAMSDQFNRTLGVDVAGIEVNDPAAVQRMREAMRSINDTSSETEAPALWRRGTLPSGAQPVSLYDWLGLMHYAITGGKGNPVFRQYGELYFGSHDEKAFLNACELYANTTINDDVFSHAIRASFKIAASGVSPSAAIEGQVDSLVAADTLNRFGLDRRIESDADVDALLDSFIEGYNRWVKIYNQAQRQLTDEGVKMTFDSTRRNEISGRDDPQAARAFMKVMKDVRIDRFLASSKLDERLDGLTMQQVVDRMMHQGRRSYLEFMSYDTGVQAFMNRLVGAAEGEKRALSSRIKGIINRDDMSHILRRYNDANGVLSPNDQLAVAGHFDGINMVLPKGIGIESGITSYNVIGTRIGQRFMSDDHMTRETAVRALSLNTQYRPLVQAIREGSPEERMRAVEQLVQKANINELHRMISDEILGIREPGDIQRVVEGGELLEGAGSTGILDVLTDLDVTNDQVEDWLERLAPTSKEFYDGIDVLVDSLMTEDSEFAIGALNDRLRKANDAFTNAEKHCWEAHRTDIAEIAEIASNPAFDQQMGVSWFLDCINNPQISYDRDLLGSMIYAAGTMSHESVEKAVAPHVATHYAMSQEYIVNGGPMSFTSERFGAPTGVLSMDEFASSKYYLPAVLADPDMEVEVYDFNDPDGGTCTLTRDAIMMSVDPSWTVGQDFTWGSIMSLLETYPQLAGTLAPGKAQAQINDGIANVTHAQAGTLKGSLLSWMRAHQGPVSQGDTLLEHTITRYKRRVSNYLSDQSWYPEMVVAAIDANTPGGIKSIINDPRKLAQQASKYHQRFVNSFYAAAVNRRLTGTNAFQTRVRDTVNRNIVDSVDKIWRSVELAADTFSSTVEGGINSALSQAMIEDCRTISFSMSSHRDVSNDIQAICADCGLQNVPSSLTPVRAGTTMAVPALDPAGIMGMSQDIMDATQTLAAMAVDMAEENVNATILGITEEQLTDASAVYAEQIAQANGIPADVNDQRYAQILARVRQSIGTDFRFTRDPTALSNAWFSRNSPNDRQFVEGVIVNVSQRVGSANWARSMEGRVRSAYSNGVDLDAVRAITRDVNAKMAESVVSALKRKVPALDLNGNFYLRLENDNRNFVEAVNSFADSEFDDIVGDAPAALGADLSEIDFNLPSISTVSDTAEGIINNMRLMADSGMNPVKVSVNGGVNKQCMGYGLLTETIDNGIPPRQGTAGELVAEYDARRRDHRPSKIAFVTAYDPANPPTSADIRRVNDLTAPNLRQNPDMPVWWYDPDQNTHGVSTFHTTAPSDPSNRDYHRFSRIMNELIAFSQEDMVLKTKKRLGTSNVIASARAGVSSYGSGMGPGSRRIGPDALDAALVANDPAAAQGQLRDRFQAWIKTYSAALAEQFSRQPLSDLGYGLEQAEIIARAMSPGIKVALADGTASIIDVNRLFQDPQAFASRVMEITGNGQVPIDHINVFTISPQQGSSRILGRVAPMIDQIRGPQPGQGGTLNPDEVRRAATEAFTNWEDYNVSSMDVSHVLSRFSPVSSAWNSLIVAADAMTPVQKMNDLMTDGAFGSGNTSEDAGSTGTASGFFDDNDGVIREGRKLYSMLFGNDSRAIVKVFASPAINQSSHKSIGADSYIRQLSDGSIPKKTHSDAAVLLLVDSSNDANGANERLYQSAYREALERNCALIVSDRVANRHPHTYRTGSTINLAARMAGAADGGGYQVILPTREQNRRNTIIDTGTSDLGRLHPDRIFGLVVDVQNNMGLGTSDASMLLPNRMISLSTMANGTMKVDYGKLLGDNGQRRRIASVDDLARLSNELLNGDESHLKLDGLDDPDANVLLVRNSVRRFLAGVSANGNIVRSGTGPGETVMMVTDGENFAPVIIPKNAPRHIDSIYLHETPRGLTTVSWSGEAGFEPGRVERMKMNVTGLAFKAEANVGVGAALPIDAYGEELGVISDDTYSGRAIGKEHQLLVNALYYSNLKHRGTLLYQRGQNGRWEYSDNIVQGGEILSATEAGRGKLNALVNGDRATWKEVESGNILLCGPGNSTANMAVQDAVRACLQFGVEPQNLFTTFNLDGRGDMRVFNRNFKHHKILDALSDESLLNMYSHFTLSDRYSTGVNSVLCTAPGEQTPAGTVALVDSMGNSLVNMVDRNGNRFGQLEYARVLWGDHRVIGDQSQLAEPGDMASYAYQHMYSRGEVNGYLDSEVDDVIKYANAMLGRAEWGEANGDSGSISRTAEEKSLASQLVGELPDNTRTMAEIFRDHPTDTFAEHRMWYLREKMGRAITKERKVRAYNDKNELEILDNPLDPKDDRTLKLRDAVADAQSRLGAHWNFRALCIAQARLDGATWRPNGENNVGIDTLADGIRKFTDNFEKGWPLVNETTNGTTLTGRFARSIVSEDELQMYWRSKPARRLWSSIEEMREAMFRAGRDGLRQISSLSSLEQSKKEALIQAYEWDYDRWGIRPQDTGDGYIYAGVYLDDQIRESNRLSNAISRAYGDGMYNFDQELWDELSERQLNMQTDFAKLASPSRRTRTVDMPGTRTGTMAINKTSDASLVNKVLNGMTELSKVMALMNPAVFVSNVIDRGTHQGIMNASMHLGHSIHLGPYSGRFWPNQDIVNKAVNDPLALKFYTAYRTAGLNGQEIEFLTRARSAEQLDQFLDEYMKGQGGFEKFCNRIYGLSSGGNFMIKGQFRNFINRFAMFCETEPGQDVWITRPEGGLSRMEAMLSADNGGAHFIQEVLGLTQHTGPNTMKIAMQALNSAKQGDMAQRNVVSMMYTEVVRRMPISKFFVTTTISRFPQYTINLSNRIMNWVLPMSSINYVLTEKVAEMSANKAARDENYIDPHYETAQVHRNLREAMLVDITHMGVGLTAMALMGISGAIQPPDDEDKMNNVDEWTVCGLRVGEAWWIQDILGPALPMACFGTSVKMGKPRFDVLFSGIAQACYSNPVVKVADAVGFMLEPEGTFLSDYNEDVLKYEDAKGGPPAWTDWLQSNATGFGLSWISQFITPSLLRDAYIQNQQWEASYNRVFKETETGVLSEEGEAGETEKTTYADAMVRRATRRNPVLGFLMDMVLQPNTGYMWGDMPRTVMYDEAQMQAMENWSIEGLEPEEQQAKLLEIIVTMQQYDDMEELASTGFYLDSYTKAALSSMVWDNVAAIDDWYLGLKEDGLNDYYWLGDGDFMSGQSQWAEITKTRNHYKQFWSDFYYDKVKSSALNRKMVTYNRYNTTYERDANGEWYATGYRPQGLLPFVSAPGTLEYDEGTAGYEEDWAAISAVTGKPMGDRALVPTLSDYDEWPSLEFWSGDGNGNGYSNLHNQWYGNGGDTASGNDLDGTGSGDGDTTTSSTSGGRRYGYGGGGYSGGGSSYTPKVYSNTGAAYAPRAEDMKTGYMEDTRLDYLRPSFETKGSREAYKREDI